MRLVAGQFSDLFLGHLSDLSDLPDSSDSSDSLDFVRFVCQVFLSKFVRFCSSDQGSGVKGGTWRERSAQIQEILTTVSPLRLGSFVDCVYFLFVFVCFCSFLFVFVCFCLFLFVFVCSC